MRGDNVQDRAGNAVFVRERHAAEWMPYLLSKFALDHIARRILIILQRFAHIGQERTGNEIVALNRDAAAEGFLEHVSDANALPGAGIQMLAEGHGYGGGRQGGRYPPQHREAPASAPPSRG